MVLKPIDEPTRDADLCAAAIKAAAAIPPAWPLAASVAVNPFLGQASQGFEMAWMKLARLSGTSLTMPRSFYQHRLSHGHITDRDLADALTDCNADTVYDLATVKAAAAVPEPPISALPTIADLAAQVSGIDWPALIADRFGAWAACYTDEGQAQWSGPRDPDAYTAWRRYAGHDRTLEIVGLTGFTNRVRALPNQGHAALAAIDWQLSLSPATRESYFHQMLLSLGGWSQYARHRQFSAELVGQADNILIDFLVIRLTFEVALFDHYLREIYDDWQRTLAHHASPLIPTPDQRINLILHRAFEQSTDRELARTLAAPSQTVQTIRPILQAAFCIDVRSEPFRFALESLDDGIRTVGFAGFFGLATAHRPFGSDVEDHHLPVLITPQVASRSGDPANHAAIAAVQVKARAKRAWDRFKQVAVSSFTFVEAMGAFYAVSLVRDAVGLRPASPRDEPAPRFDPPLDLETRLTLAQSILRAMMLTQNFAPLVLLIGHGAQMVNNPHRSSLQCGACGGHAGSVNGRLLAGLLNDPEVRVGLAARGLSIPTDTFFLAATHDTTQDSVTLHLDTPPPASHRAIVAQSRQWLARAGTINRNRRAKTLPGARHALRLARNWATVRPEWGLAGCSSFIAAPRHLTRGKSFDGRAFLHEYDWRQDPDWQILTQIMTAPMVVASWINLHYYGATVAPSLFGGGNKLLHNIVGGIGVVEGNGGLLRMGLPWQSVHDGSDHRHEPVRLSVCLAAPRRAITLILDRYPAVRDLFDHHWLGLFALDDAGRIAWRYRGKGGWTVTNDTTTLKA